MNELFHIRQEIDAIDEQLLELLNQRCLLAQKIGNIKNHKGLPIYSPEREAEVLQRLMARNQGPLSSTAIRGIYREVMSAALALEKPVTIACFSSEEGPAHHAARAHFGTSVQYAFYNHFQELFASVKRGDTDGCVVPIEDKDYGIVTQTLTALIATDLMICAEIIHPLKVKDPGRSSRYFVLARTSTAITGQDRTALILRIEDRPAALIDVLKPFQETGIQLGCFSGISAAKGSEDIHFYLEINGHARDTALVDLLRELSRRCRAVKVLGSYPQQVGN